MRPTRSYAVTVPPLFVTTTSSEPSPSRSATTGVRDTPRGSGTPERYAPACACGAASARTGATTPVPPFQNGTSRPVLSSTRVRPPLSVRTTSSLASPSRSARRGELSPPRSVNCGKPGSSASSWLSQTTRRSSPTLPALSVTRARIVTALALTSRVGDGSASDGVLGAAAGSAASADSGTEPRARASERPVSPVTVSSGVKVVGSMPRAASTTTEWLGARLPESATIGSVAPGTVGSSSCHQRGLRSSTVGGSLPLLTTSMAAARSSRP